MNNEPLAIVGMACRFPGHADSAQAFWDLLCAGTDAIRDVPTDRWDVRKFFDPDPDAIGKGYTRQGGFLSESIWHFDPAFFGISPREAAVMDPQQRLMLEVTWEAFEHAGMVLDDELRKRVGVFVGAFCFDNAVQQLSQPSRDAISSHTATSASMVMLSNRISYVFDLQGPSFTVDTACSSSLVTTHLGCRAIWDGECDVAVIGGVNVMLRPESTILECKGGFLSKDARCRTFDASANGYVRAEGAGVVVVRPLSAALAANDRIIALIRGTGVNQDGRTSSITVPNGQAQEALIRQVCTATGIDPGQIGYVEAHGTGTPVGDPIESSALGNAIGLGREQACAPWVGSVKTNMGHLEAAAGVAGLMKAALCLQHQQVPPHLHLKQLNPKIDLQALGLRVPQRVEALDPELGRFAAINSFGYGGTNAHALIERAPERAPVHFPAEDHGPRLVPLSARTDGALAAYAGAVASQLREQPSVSLAALGHALSVRRAHHDHRALIVANDRAGLLESLDRLAAGEREPALRTGRGAEGRRLVWVYTGMGAQWWGMGRSLFQANAVFRDAIAACDHAWRQAGGDGLLSLFDPAAELAAPHGEPMKEPRDAQPANLALQVGVTQVMRSLGLEADAIVGHSVGEIGAAWAAGALSLEQAFRLTYHRSRLQQELLGQGTMLALPMPAATAREQILALAPDVEIAAFNDANAVTLGGREEGLLRIAEWARVKQVSAPLLKVGVAYHTRQMEPIRERFHAALARLQTQAPRIDLYSTVTGAKVSPGEQDLAYWWRNAREPVLLADAMQQLRADGFDAFIEVGPHAVLGASILRTVPHASSWPSQRRGNDEQATLLAAVSDAYCAGASIDWRRLYPLGDAAVRAPRYPFQREALWRETAASRADRLVEELHPLLHQRLAQPAPAWRTTLNERFLPWLPDHRITGALVFPGAGYAVAALAAAEATGRGNAVENLEFSRPLEPRSQTMLQIDFDPRDGHVTLSSQPPGEDAAWHRHAVARLPEGRTAAPAAIDLGPLRARCRTDVDVEQFYRLLNERGLQYGPAFRCIRALSVGADEAIATLRSDDADAARYLVHPALLDAAFQSMLGLPSGGQASGTYVPVLVRALRLHAHVGQAVIAHVRVSRRTAGNIQGDIRLLDDAGRVLLEVEGVRCQRVGATGNGNGDDGAKRLYAWQWETSPAPALAESAVARWLVLSDRAGVALRLEEAALGLKGLDLECVPPDFASGPAAGFAGYAGVLDLRAVDLDLRGDDASGEIASANLLALVQKLAQAGTPAPKLVVVTHLALPAGQAEVVPAGGAVCGLARVAMSELPALALRLIDIDHRGIDARRLLAEMLSADDENEVAWRGADRLVPRLDRWQAAPAPLAQRPVDEPVRLVLGTPGVLDSLHWVADRRRPPGRGEVEIRVHHTSLNFKDLMKALNMLSAAYIETTFIGEHLGMECSGTVVAVGEGVTDYAPGDAVIAIDTNGCFRSYHTVGTGYLFHKPEVLSFDAAPSLIAYVTPYYALKYLANVQPGETVLIHSASGGVGLAAIEVARWLGAEVVATAGSDAKRAFLRERGVKHVFDSRSLEFAEDVMQLTGRRGVDVVLNSLAAEAARKSLSILASHGRFIEIGKKDIAEGGLLGLAEFDRNLMYAAVDTDRMGAERPVLFRRLIAEVLDLITAGRLAAVPTQVYPAVEVGDAFRAMARAQHIGKIVLDMSRGAVPVAHGRGVAVRADRSWLVTGGLGGFGLQAARWLVAQGVRELVLVGRTGASRPEARRAIEEMEAAGAKVRVEALDVSDGPAVERLMASVASSMVPLQGIVHGAMVLDDGPIDGLTAERLAKVMRPKALGAWNLHRASLAMPIEAFVMFSSVASFIGNASQGAYVAANGFLDALAWHRRASGRPALTVNWGAIADTGVVARNEGTAAYLDNMGIAGMAAASCTHALGQLLETDATQVGVVEMNWSRWAASAGAVVRSPRFGRLVTATGKSQAEDSAVVVALRALPKQERLAQLQEHLREQLARVMHQDASKVDVSLSLDNMGVDSLMAVELINRLRSELGVELSAMTVMMHGATVAKLAENLQQMLFPEGEQAAASTAPAVDVVDAMSEAELDALLALG